MHFPLQNLYSTNTALFPKMSVKICGFLAVY